MRESTVHGGDDAKPISLRGVFLGGGAGKKKRKSAFKLPLPYILLLNEKVKDQFIAN